MGTGESVATGNYGWHEVPTPWAKVIDTGMVKKCSSDALEVRAKDFI